ncbi:FAD-binding oxidoreductase [filamentous cyanobacterium LEGE 11480]|uniref:FAD-binding oxidoreductase n=1 Tax=Romeriopsis navalis LEGE 11480 TaxID=2777977 RepID=A0A928Z1J1_9CYAN|nr:FAD-binding oxidoreductase [Romeriopsis navalis]MBE9029401.1 FAD-binding oxidoreductase [Romeriopsis navalis LEGE 11480]
MGQAEATLAETILKQVPGALPGLRRVDHLWSDLRQGNVGEMPTVVHESDEVLDAIEYDVAICGGTLGILIGASLVRRGLRVVLLERGELQGRVQEWNISRRELQEFVELGLLTEAELQAVISSEFNPVRVGFDGGEDIWVEDVLNIGVSPVKLLETLKQTFLEAGGKLLEHMPFASVNVHPNGVVINAEIKAQLLLDVMGHFSPIVKQARQGQKPDAVCLVVGTCAEGFAENQAGDLIYSFTPIQHQCQYFWEAFPASDGRTTYLFTYIDADPDRFSLEFLFDEYFRLLPQYQNVELEQLDFKRALFGFFPCYRNSPLAPSWNRILPLGDSSGLQSPLSFGGFGAMVRHLGRLTDGIVGAVAADRLTKTDLAKLLPYQPNLSVTWLFQKSMSVGVNQKAKPDQINQLLVNVFAEMQALGEPVLKPFLQDVVQFLPLLQTLGRTAIVHPTLTLKLLPQVGVPTLVNWMGHYASLAGFTGLSMVGDRLQNWVKQLPPPERYDWQCRLDAWKYGSGQDYSQE